MDRQFENRTGRQPPDTHGSRKRQRLPTLLICALLLTACQPTVYLMPTPEVLRSGTHDPFSGKQEEQKRNEVTVAYATNRLPVGIKDERHYVTLFDDNLRLGVAQIRIGTQQFSAEELRRQSTTSTREFDIPLTLENAVEIGRVGNEDGNDTLSADARTFFTQVNEALARSAAKDLIVYVHGANNNFYRSMSQGAQFHHFTGRNAVVLAFSWPSAASLLRYAVDVNNARETVPVFSRLLELLAQHTNAHQIDVLAYSAGAQVLSPALALLAKRGTGTADLRQRLRLGEIYFAAPDVDFDQFVNDLRHYIDLPNHVTLTVNPGDVVLGLAASKHGVSRAGRPDPDELTDEERELITRATREMAFDVLWIEPESIPGLAGGSHAFWYDHPWVSTDVLLQLLFNARPAERGLESVHHGNTRLWRFPPDYGDNVDEILTGLRKKYLPTDR